MNKIEKLAEQIYKEAIADGEPMTKEESIEVALMEINAKQNKNYTQSTVEKKVSTRERKVDENKKFILEHLKCVIDGMADNAEMKNETELNFEYCGNAYTLKLIKHRKKS
jgi:hypothetical protein